MPRVPGEKVSDGGSVVLVYVVIVSIYVVVIKRQRGVICRRLVVVAVGGFVKDSAKNISTPLIRTMIVI